MQTWDAKSWAMLVAVAGGAICCIIAAVEGNYGAVGAIVGSFSAALLGLRNGQRADTIETKLDDNTALTVEGTAVAAKNAKVAAVTAVEAKEAAIAVNDTVITQLNGGISHTIEQALAPIKDAIHDHALADEANMAEVRNTLQSLHEKLANGKTPPLPPPSPYGAH